MAGLVQTARALQERLDQLIRELVSFEDQVAQAQEARSTGRGPEPKRVAVVGKCSYSCVCAPLNPALWSTLPKELLQLVFARLPLPKINEFRCLSREWNLGLYSNSEYMQACTEARPTMFGMITERGRGLISVRMYDAKVNRWCFSLHQMKDEHLPTMCAGDRGLVCLVSSAMNKRRSPLVITVINPLTGKQRKISPHALSEVQPSMVQLVVDEDTKCYKVLVVGAKRHGGGDLTQMVAEVYCSETGVWRSPSGFTDLIFGYQYQWYGELGVVDPEEEEEECFFCEYNFGPCVYDCTRGRFHKFDVRNNPCRGVPVKSYALLKDRLFVLHEEVFRTPTGVKSSYYFVSEYQYHERCEPRWVKFKVHSCGEFREPPQSVDYAMNLYACRGFLLLKAANMEEGNAFEHELAWLYDMATSEWRAISAIPGEDCVSDALFELRWDAVP